MRLARVVGNAGFYFWGRLVEIAPEKCGGTTAECAPWRPECNWTRGLSSEWTKLNTQFLIGFFLTTFSIEKQQQMNGMESLHQQQHKHKAQSPTTPNQPSEWNAWIVVNAIVSASLLIHTHTHIHTSHIIFIYIFPCVNCLYIYGNVCCIQTHHWEHANPDNHNTHHIHITHDMTQHMRRELASRDASSCAPREETFVKFADSMKREYRINYVLICGHISQFK